MSLDSAIIDLSGAFEYGQGYVALSRVRSLVGLYLEGFNDKALMLHPDIIRADATFRARSDAARKRIGQLTREETENLENNFLRAIGATDRIPKKKPQVQYVSKLSDLHEKYPSMGKPWTKDDDLLVAKMFKDNVKNADIAKHFGRKPSAIRSRLGHLGLIPDFWKNRRK